MAELSTAAKNRLPDRAFAVVLPGGRKDETGRTAPRRLRKFPIRRADGSVDRARVRNALARIAQTRATGNLTSSQIAAARRRIQAAARSAGIGEPAER